MAVDVTYLNSNSVTNIDANFERTKEALEKALGREGDLPNHMETDLDMNGNDILNINTIDANNISLDGTPILEIGNIDIVVGMADEIATVSNNNGNITIVAENITDVNTVAENVTDVNRYANTYLPPSSTPPTTRVDGSPLQAGDLWYDTSINEMKKYDGSAFTLVTTSSLGGLATATGTFGSAPDGEIFVGTFTTLFVWVNGILLTEGDDYTEDGSSFTILSPQENDEWAYWAYQANDATDYYTKTEADALLDTKFAIDGSTPMTGDLPMGGNKITGLADATEDDEAVNLGQISSAIASVVSAKSADYTVLDTDRNTVLSVNATAAERTITLLSAATAGNGYILSIRKADSGDNFVVIDADGSETINGSATYSLTLPNQLVKLVSDGTNWLVVEELGTVVTGFNENGNFAKYADGTLECWNANIATSNNANTSNVTLPWNPAIPFSEPPQINANMHFNSSGITSATCGATSVDISNHGAGIYYIRTPRVSGSQWPTNSDAFFSVRALGRWFEL